MSDLTPPNLYTTPETQRALGDTVIRGLREGLPEGQRVIVTTRGDFDAQGRPTMRLRDQFLAAGLDPSTPSGQTAAEIIQRELAARVQMPEHGADIAAIPGGYLPSGVGALLLQPLGTETPHSFLASQTGLSPGALSRERIPGTPQDILLLLGHHEIDHTGRQGRDPEYVSDAHAYRQYQVDLTAGRATDPETPYFFRAARTMGYMLGTRDAAYDLTPLAPMPGEAMVPEHQRESALTGMRDARGLVLDRVARTMGITNDPLLQLRTMTDLELPHPVTGRIPHTFSTDVSDRMRQALTDNNTEAARRLIRDNPIPASAQQAYKELQTIGLRSDVSIRLSGADNVGLRAQMMYEASRQLLAEGAFRDNPHGQTMVQRFVDGAQRYGRTAFNVDPADRPGPPDLGRGVASQQAQRQPDRAPSMVN